MCLIFFGEADQCFERMHDGMKMWRRNNSNLKPQNIMRPNIICTLHCTWHWHTCIMQRCIYDFIIQIHAQSHFENLMIRTKYDGQTQFYSMPLHIKPIKFRNSRHYSTKIVLVNLKTFQRHFTLKFQYFMQISYTSHRAVMVRSESLLFIFK